MRRKAKSYTPEQLEELLEAWRRPGGVLAREQLKALLAWGGTPPEERDALGTALEATEQQVDARPLAPQQRRGHVGWLDRVRGLLPWGRRAR